jgi:hypothetical protein
LRHFEALSQTTLSQLAIEIRHSFFIALELRLYGRRSGQYLFSVCAQIAGESRTDAIRVRTGGDRSPPYAACKGTFEFLKKQLHRPQRRQTTEPDWALLRVVRRLFGNDPALGSGSAIWHQPNV